MQINSIRVEGMHNTKDAVYDLRGVNYLYGANGAGKSTVLQAIQLALLGYVPATGKSKSSIVQHAGNHTMAVTAMLQDGDTSIQVQRVWTAIGSKNISSVSIIPESVKMEDILRDIELPIFNFDEFLAMTANNQKDWFMKFLPPAEHAISWETDLMQCIEEMKLLEGTDVAAIQPAMAEVNRLVKEGHPAIIVSQKLNEWLKSAVSFKKTELQRVQNTIESMIHYDDIDESLCKEEILTEIDTISEKKAAAIRYNSLKAQHDKAAYELSQLADYATPLEYNDHYDALKGNEAEIASEIAELDAQIRELTDKGAALTAEIHTISSIVQSSGECPYTHKECNDVSKLIAMYTDKLSKLDSELAKIKEQVSSLEANKSAKSLAWTSLRNEIWGIERNTRQYEELAARQIDLPEIDETDLDTASMDIQLTALNDQLAKIKSNEMYNNLMTRVANDKYIVEQTIEIYKIWTTFTGPNGLQSLLAKAPFVTLQNNLDEYIHKFFGEDISASFCLTEKANSFSFGITRNNVYVPFSLLSSGEKCMYALALMSCIVAQSASPLKLVLIDDVLDHLDDTNANKVFQSLARVEDIQYILAGVKPCGDDSIVIHIG